MLHVRIVPEAEIETRRREPRSELAAKAPLRPLGATSVEARLVNISAHGFMAETEALIAPGSRIWLTLPAAGRVNALVVWAKSGRIGGEFAEAIEVASVMEASPLPRANSGQVPI